MNAESYEKNRTATYRMFARLFREEPSIEFLTALGSANEQCLPDAFRALATSLHSLDENLVRRDIAAEYAALFLGMSASPLIPFESAFSEEAGLLMGDACMDVIVRYRAEGLATNENYRALSDHIATELDFYATLCEKGMADDALEKQQDFFRTHMANWMPAFCDELVDRAQTDYWQALGSMLKQTIAEENALFAND